MSYVATDYDSIILMSTLLPIRQLCYCNVNSVTVTSNVESYLSNACLIITVMYYMSYEI